MIILFAFIVSLLFYGETPTLSADLEKYTNEQDTTGGNEIFKIVEEPATPQGGYNELYTYIARNLKYPAEARRNGVQGKVYVQFLVTEEGSLNEVEVVKGIGYGCDLEVVRVIKGSPKWTAGKQHGKPVSQRIVLPVTFALGKESKFLNPEYRSTQSPQYPGGEEAYRHFLKVNLSDVIKTIPPNNLRNSVKISFLVDSLGQLSNFNIIQGLTEDHNKEVLRVFQSMPRWVPGKRELSNTNMSITKVISFDKYSMKDYQRAYEIYYQGVKKFHKGKFDKALEKFDSAIEIVPTELNFYFNRAMCSIKLNDKISACKDLSLIEERDKEAKLLYSKYCDN